MKFETPKGYGEAPQGKQGTPDEIEAVEKGGWMTKTEKELSETREKRTHRFQEAGVTGELSYNVKTSPASKMMGHGPMKFKEMTGTINGQDVVLRKSENDMGGYTKEEYSATVDGKQLTGVGPKLAWEQFEQGFATDKSKEEADIVHARYEASHRVYEQAVKEENLAQKKLLESIGIRDKEEDKATKLSQDIKDRM